MATIRPITAQRTIDTGSIPGTQIDDSIGQGLRAAGQAVMGLGSTLHEIDMRRERMRMQMVEFKQDEALHRHEDDKALEFVKIQGEIDPSGDGFTDRVSDAFRNSDEKFLASVPRELQPKVAEKLTTSREAWLNKAAAAQIDQSRKYVSTSLAERADKLGAQVLENPSLLESAVSDYSASVDAAPNLSPSEKIALKKDGERAFLSAKASNYLRTDPEKILGPDTESQGNPVGAVVSKIIGAESGGDPNAKNPKSSASGVGQFTNGTWLATIKKHRPDIASGRSDKEILSLKNDARLGREMTTRLTEDNARDLASAGMSVTPGTLYLAHFAGIGGARAVLRANPGASLSDILDPASMKANGFLNGKTAGWLREWADKKMGGKGSVYLSPEFAGLPTDDRLALYDKAVAALQKQTTERNAQQTAFAAAENDRVSLGIRTGEIVSEQEILANPYLDAGQKSVRIGQLREQRGDAMATAEAVSLFSAGNLRVDPYDSTGRKTVDNAWTAVSQAVPPEQLQASAEEMVRQTGVVPQSVVNNIRQGLTSQDVDAVMQAAQMAQRLSTVDSAALGRRDGGSEAQQAADDFGFYVNRLNLSPEDAARRLAENRDPEKQRDRKAIEPAAKEFIKGLQDFDLASQFDDSLLGLSSNPSLGMTPAQELGIKADFLAIAEDEFYRANGDPDIAQNRAVEQMKRLYGVTEFGGVKAVVKHPPERYWPVSSFGMEQEPGRISGSGGQGPGAEMGGLSPFGGSSPTPTLDYARKQLESDVSAMGLNADPSTIQLVTTPETDAMVKRGELPAYGILFKDKDGMYQTIPGKLWRPDITDALKATEAEEQRRIDAVREKQEAIENRSSFWRIPTRDEWGHALRLEVPGPDHTLSEQQRERDAKPPKPIPQKPDTPANQIQGQRQQLFNDARDSGVLPGGS